MPKTAVLNSKPPGASFIPLKGTLVSHLPRIMEEAGLEPGDLVKASIRLVLPSEGAISQDTARRIAAGGAYNQITLEILCQILGLQPGDLLEIIPEGKPIPEGSCPVGIIRS